MTSDDEARGGGTGALDEAASSTEAELRDQGAAATQQDEARRPELIAATLEALQAPVAPEHREALRGAAPAAPLEGGADR
jgi:hypothetical protein